MLEEHETNPFRHQTAWFRDGWPFVALERELANVRGAPLIVSAGCSTGEEARSIALTLLRLGRAGRVVGLDSAPDVLAKAREGTYRMRAPQEWAAPFFAFRGGVWSADQRLRERVTFARADLRQPWPVRSAHVVFLRYVIRYFDNAARAVILRQAHVALVPDGLLILGSDHVERAFGGAPRFEPVREWPAAYRAIK
jgi:chemotaxis protein methyltransferase CheR